MAPSTLCVSVLLVLQIQLVIMREAQTQDPPALHCPALTGIPGTPEHWDLCQKECFHVVLLCHFRITSSMLKDHLGAFRHG